MNNNKTSLTESITSIYVLVFCIESIIYAYTDSTVALVLQIISFIILVILPYKTHLRYLKSFTSKEIEIKQLSQYDYGLYNNNAFRKIKSVAIDYELNNIRMSDNTKLKGKLPLNNMDYIDIPAGKFAVFSLCDLRNVGYVLHVEYENCFDKKRIISVEMPERKSY